MPQYKLTYFNGKGRAEVARLIFATVGVEYEDCRLSREQWMPIKPGTCNMIYHRVDDLRKDFEMLYATHLSVLLIL